MSHYERRLEEDREHLRSQVSKVGGQVHTALSGAMRALFDFDQSLCGPIILGDLAINREVAAIDQACHAFVARHLPSAGHLRFVSAIMRLAVALERCGDYAVTIARQTSRLKRELPSSIAAELREVSAQTLEMFAAAVQAFISLDSEQAKRNRQIARSISEHTEAIFERVLAKKIEQRSDLAAVLSVLTKTQRVCDQAQNICEETLFVESGHVKEPPIYQILFLDARDTLMGPLAQAIARKAFPKSGRFKSAGWAAGTRISDEALEVARRMGLDLTGIAPRKLELERDELVNYHVVVCLAGGWQAHLPEVPYHTVRLEWDLPRLSDADAQGPISQQLDAVVRQLNAEIHDLMVTMCGPQAM